MSTQQARSAPEVMWYWSYEDLKELGATADGKDRRLQLRYIVSNRENRI